VVSLS